MPLFKHSNLKYFWLNLKSFLTAIITHDKSFLVPLLEFLYKSWPSRYPEKVISYIEFIEYLFNTFTEDLVCEKNTENTLILVFKKLCSKLLSNIKDDNLLISDKTLILFKNNKFLDLFNEYKFETRIIIYLTDNIKIHWSEEIKGISKLVLSRFKSYSPDSFEQIDNELKNYIENLNLSNISEEIWDILRFDLKAD